MFINGLRLGVKLRIDAMKEEYPPLLPHASQCKRLLNPLR